MEVMKQSLTLSCFLLLSILAATTVTASGTKHIVVLSPCLGVGIQDAFGLGLYGLGLTIRLTVTVSLRAAYHVKLIHTELEESAQLDEEILEFTVELCKIHNFNPMTACVGKFSDRNLPYQSVPSTLRHALSSYAVSFESLTAFHMQASKCAHSVCCASTVYHLRLAW